MLQRRPGEPGVVYVAAASFRRQPRRRSSAGTSSRRGDRPDLLGAVYFGDSLLYWRIADVNAVVDPHELTDTLGRRVIIPQPPGV